VSVDQTLRTMMHLKQKALLHSAYLTS